MSVRQKRVEERLFEVLRAAFFLEFGDDPRFVDVQITSVSVTPDFRIAHVNYLIGTVDSPRDADREREVAKDLVKVQGLMRRQVNAEIPLKYSPELHFQYDEGLLKRTKIDSILAELEREKK